MPISNNNLRLPPPQHSTTTADDPLRNLATIQTRVDSLSQILSNSVNTNTPLPKPQSDTITAELISAIHHIIINGAALLASSHHQNPSRSDGEDCEIVELDVMEITADHCHTCKVCGKGFKRDANLRMHMRSHGDKFKTLESLSKPTQNKNNLKISDNSNGGGGRKTRFSCPFVGCIRNKRHKDFRSLKSAVCVKNHFKRFHCPKMFSCNRCNKKSFSVLSDLKSHMKHCSVVKENEEKKWEYCSCGLRFLNKDELFEHVSLSHGHMPVAAGTGSSSNFNVNFVGEQENGVEIGNNNNNNNNNNIQGFKFDGFVEEDDQFLQEMGLWSSIEDLVNF